MNRSYISFMLASLIAMQSIIPATSIPVVTKPVDTKQLDSYFIRLKRGLNCYRKRIPCSKEDQQTIQRTAAGLIMILLAAVLGTKYSLQWHKKRTAHTTIEQFIQNSDEEKLDSMKQIVAMAQKKGIPLPIEYALAIIIDKIAHLRSSRFAWANKKENSKKLSGKALKLASATDPRTYATKETLDHEFKTLQERSTVLTAIAKFLIDQGFDPDKKMATSGVTINQFRHETIKADGSIRSQINTLLDEQPSSISPYLNWIEVQDLGLVQFRFK